MSLQGSSWELAGWVDHGMYEKLPDTLDIYGASWYGEKACPYLKHTNGNFDGIHGKS